MTDATSAQTDVLHPNLALALERITDGFFALDAQWRIAYMNAEARRLLLVEGDPVGRDWLAQFPKARGLLFESEYRRAMREQQPVQFVEYSATAQRWLEVKAYPSSDGLSVYFRDVSSRVEAQREVERNARRQRGIIELGRAALGGRTLDELVSDALDLLRDVLDVPILEYFEHDYREGRFSVHTASGWPAGAALDPARPSLEHIRLAARTGDPFVIGDLSADPRGAALRGLLGFGIRASAGALVGTPYQPYGVLVVYDERPRVFSVGDVRFIESIGQTLAEAAASEISQRRMQLVVENIRDAFISLDHDLRITYVNARMADFWKRSRVELIGTPISTITETLGDAGTYAQRNFVSALTTDRATTFETPYNDRWYEFRLHPFSEGLAVYVRDVTRRKMEERRIIELNAELEIRVAERTRELELANAELESFSYSVSHDLRAPLRAIDGFSQALVEDYGDKLDATAANYLERVRKAAQRMADLIDALLQLARVARTTIRMADVDLSSLASSIVAELREREPDRDVEVTVAPGMHARGEASLLRAVLENLIGNAWKFTRGRAGARIEIGVCATGEFFVRDNGAGFDMSYRNKLFGAFQRLHAVEEFEGTGIGLATVARIIHRHGGEIRAEGAVGEGAVFSFTLPVAPRGVS
jgi:signal transduction histidine kinase